MVITLVMMTTSAQEMNSMAAVEVTTIMMTMAGVKGEVGMKPVTTLILILRT
jgi:hypothetical protein